MSAPIPTSSPAVCGAFPLVCRGASTRHGPSLLLTGDVSGGPRRRRCRPGVIFPDLAGAAFPADRLRTRLPLSVRAQRRTESPSSRTDRADNSCKGFGRVARRRKWPGRPFVVAAAGIEVRAVGTAFSVKRETAAVEVIVTHGSVALEQTAASRSAPPPPLATLDAGMLALVELNPAPVPAIRSIAPNELSQRLAWRGPRLEFSRAPLAEAADLFNRHAPSDSPRLVIGDAETGAIRISGVFRADNAEAFVSLLESAFQVQAQQSDRTVFLRRAP